MTVNFENNVDGGEIGLRFKLHGRYTRVNYDLVSRLIEEAEGDLPLPGLRVKQIISHSNASPDIVKSYDYRIFHPEGHQLWFSDTTSSNSVDLTHAYVNRVHTQQQYQLMCAHLYYYDAYSDSRSPLNVFNGNNVSYS